MSKLFVGQTGTGKTTAIKNELKNVGENIIILDFNNQYDDIEGTKIVVDDINPLLSEISFRDSMALNAGYLDYSLCLFKMCKEILKDTEEYKTLDNSLKDSGIFDIKKLGLIEEATERLLISWDQTENERGRELNDMIPMKRNKKQLSLENALDLILNSKVSILKMKNLHSSQLRAITFVLLSRLSHISNNNYIVVADNLTTLFNQGNIKLFLETLNKERLDIYLAFNKVSNVPKFFFELINKYFIFRFENNSDHKELKALGLVFDKNIKKLKDGEFIIKENESKFALSN